MFADSISALMAVMVAAAVFGSWGHKLAKDYGRSPVLGFVLGAAFPVAGVGLLYVLGRKSRNRGGV